MVLDSKAWPLVPTKYVFLTSSLVKKFHEILLNGYVLNFQTVFHLKTGEDDMLTRVIKLNIIIIKEVVVIILSNITANIANVNNNDDEKEYDSNNHGEHNNDNNGGNKEDDSKNENEENRIADGGTGDGVIDLTDEQNNDNNGGNEEDDGVNENEENSSLMVIQTVTVSSI